MRSLRSVYDQSPWLVGREQREFSVRARGTGPVVSRSETIDDVTDVVSDIHEVVDRETRAWDTGDVELLLSVFHPEMVWAWPATDTSVDPIDWHLVLGKFDAQRWQAAYEAFFRTHTLVHNRRETVRVEVSAQEDAALAVVDIDTLWREVDSGLVDHWLGRTCKLYALVAGEWKMTSQVGALRFAGDSTRAVPPR